MIMNKRSKIEQLILEQDPPSSLLLSQYMAGSKKVTYNDIVRACDKERFAKVLDKACFGQVWLTPLMLIPVFVFLILWD